MAGAETRAKVQITVDKVEKEVADLRAELKRAQTGGMSNSGRNGYYAAS